jgi:ankyrin repeat protein
MQDIITLIKNRETDCVKELLDSRCFSNMLAEDRHTLLYWAAIAECVEIAELVIHRGVDINAQDEDGLTALHMAARSGDLEMVRLLLDNGADPNITSVDYGASIHEAVQSDHLDIVQLLVECNADVNLISENGESGTPLNNVVSREVTEYLISKGACVNDSDSYGHTPLHEVVIDDNIDVALTLINHGADVNARCHNGWAPLHWAVWNRHKDAVRLLLSNGADVNASVSGYYCTTGWTPSYWTSTSSFLKTAGETKVEIGWTPLHLAAIQGDAGIIKALLSEGADPDITADSLCTPLHWALLMKKDNAAKILTAHGGVDPCL